MTERNEPLETINRRGFLSRSTAAASAAILTPEGGRLARADTGASAASIAFTRRDASFTSMNAELRAWLYEPQPAARRPIVVMAHGYSATRHMVADKYAEAFCARGIAVLLYDHRGFGDSAGEPRQQINTWVQARGYLDAIAFARTLDGIDGERLAIWGDSLSGGVALVAAVVDGRAAALAVQVPALGSTLPPADADGALYRALRGTVLSGAIEPANEREVDGPMPVVSDDQVRRPSALQPLTAYRWFIEYGGRFGTGWANDVTRARPKTPAPWHPGLCAAHLTCATLFVVSPRDEMPGAAPAVTRNAFEQIRGAKEWVEIEGGHFGLLYVPSPEFDYASSTQANFLARHLLG